MSDPANLRKKVGRGFALPRPDRRSLLIGGGAATGLALAWAAWPRSASVAISSLPGEQVFGAWLKIAPDGRVTVMVPQTELGQGAWTLIAHIAADELGADWRTVAVEPAPVSAAYINHLWLDTDARAATPRDFVPDGLSGFGGWRQSLLAGSAPPMLTTGSTTQRMFEGPVRETAAVARALLCMAAARIWNVDWQACDARDGFVIHQRRRLRFGALAISAAEFDPPTFPPLRAPGSGPLFGQELPRLDAPSKIDGSFAFAADIRLPNMVFAAIRQGPHGDTRLKSYDKAAAERVPGFLAAVRQDRWVAAVATNSWAAQRALNAMDPVFTTDGQRADSRVADRRLKAALGDNVGARIAGQGSVADSFAGRPVLQAEYQVAPALHQGIETRSATAAHDDGRIQLWVASQAPGLCRAAVAAALGISGAKISLIAMPAGGAFDGALDHDVAVQAAMIARAVDRPVQLTWSRTEDLLRDLPRPPVRARVRASFSSAATIDAWHAAISTPPARHEARERLTGAKPFAALVAARGRSDAAAVAGAVPPYAIPNLAIDHLPVDVTIPSGSWRGNADSFTAFFTECFVDELARTAGLDPFTFRISMLGDQPLLANCLQLATQAGGWQGGVSGSGEGLACASLRGSHIALMAVARPGTSGLVVDRLVVAVDVGQVLNPTLVKQQIEGGLIWGLAAAVGATTRYRGGLASARRLAEIRLPDLARTPQIDIEIVTSDRPCGGVGELGVPVVAPAIANALYTMTGQRLRRLPLSTKALS